MLIRKCDRCEDIIENNCWTIYIYEEPDNMGKFTTKGALNNLVQNMAKLDKKENIYCEKCVNDIKKYIDKKPKE